jgi:hypothetical protein
MVINSKKLPFKEPDLLNILNNNKKLDSKSMNLPRSSRNLNKINKTKFYRESKPSFQKLRKRIKTFQKNYQKKKKTMKVHTLKWF